MKSPRPLVAGLLLLLLAFTAAACGGVKNPEGWAAPALDGQDLYYFPAKDRITAATTTADGAARRWTFPDKARPEHKGLKFKAVYDDPVVDASTLYFASWDGRAFALDRATGSVKWALKDEIKGGVVGGPVLAGERLILGTTDGRVYGLNAATGKPLDGWPSRGLDYSDGIWAPPVVQGETVYVATLGGELHALNLADGSEQWERPFEADGAIADLALVDKDRLFVPTLNKTVYIVDTTSGKEATASFRADDWVWSRPAVRDGVAYFGDFAGHIYALDIKTGQSKWQKSYDSEARLKSTPVVINDVLVLATREPSVHFVDVATGNRLSVVPIPDAGSVRAPLTLVDGKALVLTTKGKLFRADPTLRQVLPVSVDGEKQ